MRVYNCTLHDQDEATLGALLEYGVEFVPDALGRGRDVAVGAEFVEVERGARQVVAAAAGVGAEAILIGGLSSMAIALYQAALEAGLGVVEVRTERTRDAAGRFVFNCRGVREIAPRRGTR